jgi:hypothetical protein
MANKFYSKNIYLNDLIAEKEQQKKKDKERKVIRKNKRIVNF